MSDGTKINWADATWNIITGCSVTSPACTNCYAMRDAAGPRLRNHPSRKGMTKIVNGNPVWTGEVRFNEQWLTQPLHWKKPRTIFVCAAGDMFHPNVPDEWIDKVFAVMALAPQHQFTVLTKRSKRMRDYFRPHDRRRIESLGTKVIELGYDGPLELLRWPLPNVALGVTAEDQKRADERIPDLLATPAARRFVSIEPMLGPVKLTDVDLLPTLMRGLARDENHPNCTFNALTGETNVHPCHGVEHPFDYGLDLVICGGESGPNARPMHPDWPRSLRDQCAAVGVPFNFKQWGEWSPVNLIFDDDGGGSSAYPIDGCSNPDVHGENQHCLFWNGSKFVEWPYLDENTTSAIGSRRVGKRRAGRLLDGVEHDGVLP